MCFYGFFQTVLFHNMLEVGVEDDKTCCEWSLSNESKQPEANNQVYSEATIEAAIVAKIETQVQMHNIKINDTPFHPTTDYVFPKSKSEDRLRPCLADWFKNLPWLHYDEK